MHRNWVAKSGGRLDVPLPSEKLGIPRGGGDGKGAPRGPGLSLPSGGDEGAAPWLSLGSGVAPVAFRPQTARRAGNPCGRCQPMTIKSRYSAFGDFRMADYIKLWWLAVDRNCEKRRGPTASQIRSLATADLAAVTGSLRIIGRKMIQCSKRRGVVSLGQAPTDSKTPTTKLAHPVDCLGKWWEH